MQKKSSIHNLFSLISYKEKKEINDFYIPEINEEDKHVQNNSKQSSIKSETTNLSVDADDNNISTIMQANIEYLFKKFNYPVNKDFVMREFLVAGKYKAFIAYIDGMVDRVTINNFILRPLLNFTNLPDMGNDSQLDFLLKNVLETNQAEKVTKPADIVYGILSGNTCLYVDGCSYYLSCETKGFEKRGVETPQTEGLVRGPQEAFNENLRTNVTLIRRLIKDTNLTTEFVKVGKRTNVQCAVVYINGIINPAIVQEVKRRLTGISADLVMGDGMLEQFIEDSSYTVVPTILSTERPDRTASHLLEGRIAIIVDGTPFALIAPVTLHSFMHTPEETFFKWPVGSLIRLIRIFAVFVAALLPALYIGMVGYHTEMIPTDLMIAIISAKENVPFPTVLEVLLMELSFELIREAGVRIPGLIGNTLGIIGALILGQAAVQANIVSPVLIIIVAVTGLGNFAIPNFSVAFAVRIIRFAFIFGAALLGFYGIGLVLVAVIALLSNMKSFGVPFLSITAPKTSTSGDLIFKKPVWKQEKRPDNINPLDVRRQPNISRKWAQEDAESEERKNIDDGRRDEDA